MPPTTEPLTAERILDTAEETLRRYGPAKTTVVDVARALAVSHGRSTGTSPARSRCAMPSPAARLDRVSAPLEALVVTPGDPAERLRSWVRLLADTKQGHGR